MEKKDGFVTNRAVLVQMQLLLYFCPVTLSRSLSAIYFRSEEANSFSIVCEKKKYIYIYIYVCEPVIHR
jgi:hypothetical protein